MQNSSEKTVQKELSSRLLDRLNHFLQGRSLRFMEVCGTHTVSIFQSGLRSLLPEGVEHLSGPGCPVCVTHDGEIAAFLELAGKSGVLLATFGDLIRVPGPGGRTLKHARAEGARIEIVYSPLDALALARKNPGDTVVFLGIGFETTAPTVAATVLAAEAEKITNFCVFSLHKLVPPVLRKLLEMKSCALDGFLLPGHVSTILGLEPFGFLVDEYQIPGVVAGFTAQDILLGLCTLARDVSCNHPAIRNAYPRAVSASGNPQARMLMDKVFTPCDALWRGLGEVKASGLTLSSPYERFDARKRLGLVIPKLAPPPGCRCGDVLSGAISPHQCPLFGRACRPEAPVGPCMVSTEGSCAAWYKYGG